MFWFDKEHNETCYMDKRTLDTTLCDGRKLIVKPDVIADFRKMPFDYGKLEQTWQKDIKQGLSECWRVLKQNGTLIFKWNEEQITLPMVKPLLPCEPLIGQRRGKTVWLVFFKGESTM